MLLADAGARVVKIEQPGRGDETRRWGPPFAEGESAYYLSVNRNKESLTLNLKSEEGREIAGRLIERADVVVDNFLPDQKRNLGLSAEWIREKNPGAVHCSISGFDSDGPDADLPGYDLLAQAAAGLMAITGPADGSPSKVGVALSDVLTAHHAYGAICSSLVARERSGEGSSIEVSLIGSTLASLINVSQAHLITGTEPIRYGNAHPTVVPYEAFHATDGLFVVAAATDRHYRALCVEVLDAAQLADDPRFDTNSNRVSNREALIPELERRFATRPAAEWITRCRKSGVPAHSVDSLGNIFESGSPHIETVDHPTIGSLRMVRSPIRRDGTRPSARSAPPLLGEQTESILGELGFSADEISEMQRRGVV